MNFNSAMVRLKFGFGLILRERRRYFNASMVRLKPSVETLSPARFWDFNSKNGAVKAGILNTRRSGNLYASIPV